MQHKTDKKVIWLNNAWLKDVYEMALDERADGIHYTLEEYYQDCQADLTSAQKASHKPEWIPELQEAVNEISLIFLYGLHIPA